MRKVLLTLVAAVFMFTVNAQSIGWAKIATVDDAGVNFMNPTIGVNVGGDFDIVLGWTPGTPETAPLAGDGTDGEFDFAIRKGMSFGWIEVGNFGGEDDATTTPDESAMSISFGRSFAALFDGLSLEPTLMWQDGDMSMSMGVTVSF